MTDSLRSIRVRSALDEIRSWGYFSHVEWFEEIDSTNRYVRDRTKEGTIPLPSLVVAHRQTAGAGRGGNRWFSPDGCLMFSLSREHDMAHALLPLWVGLCVAKAIEGITNSVPQIKWPNDVYLRGKKVCGVLIEGVSRSEWQSKQFVAVIGIGINCCVDFSDASSEVQQNATSLHLHTPRESIEEHSPESVLLRVLKTWIELEQSEETYRKILSEEWSRYSFLDGRYVVVDAGGQRIAGVCCGIDEAGSMVLLDASGKRQAIIAGSVVSFEL